MSLLSLSQARATMLQRLSSPTVTETISLEQAQGRVLAEDIYSPINVPNFDNSAMDGYAVRVEDFADFSCFTMVGKAFAGNPYPYPLQTGQCVRIMTGAKMPVGANAVVMQENSQINQDGSISFHCLPKLKANIRYKGEDIAQGQLVLAKGQRLGVTHLPLVASLGISQLKVYPKVTVAILSTGDELVSVGQPLTEGQIYDTNRFAVRLMLEKLGCEILDYGILADDPVQFEQVFQQAQQRADVLITSGGVSVGEADFTKDILEKLGEIGFWKIAMKPGKPFAFGRLGDTWFCGLPGNPVSALVTFYQLVQPALLKLSGISEQQIAKFPQNLTACSASFLKKSVGRQDFQRGFYFTNEQGELIVQSVGMQGSHIFSAFHQSNCFIVLEQERGDVQIGEKVMIQPFNQVLS